MVTKGKPGRKQKQTNHFTVPAILEGETEETMEEHTKNGLKCLEIKGRTHASEKSNGQHIAQAEEGCASQEYSCRNYIKQSPFPQR